MKKLTLILLVLITPLLSEVFIISYRVSIKDNKIYGEKLNLSPIMRSMNFRSIASIEVDSDYDDTSREIVRKHKEEILEFLFKSGVKLDNQTTLSAYGSSSITALQLPVQYIAIDRTKSFSLITLLKRIYLD
jgi:hypothetical protein